MAILYKTSPYAFHTEGESLTEQEHAPETDVNIMVKRAAKGLAINTKDTGIYGYDDTTLDSVRARIQKAELEHELQKASQEVELTEKEQAELERLAPSVAKKFKFKTKSVEPVLSKPDSNPAPAQTAPLNSPNSHTPS